MFVHLHVHSEYSLLDGACRIEALAKRAKELGQTALALTDHGVMYGVIDFYDACKKHGIKPIIGCEVYTSARTRHDKTPGIDSEIGHLVLLAKNNEGYKNLISIVSAGFIEGFYYKPRIDMEVLKKYSGGIIALSACLAGDIPRAFLAGDYETAKKIAMEHLEIFGEGNFYIEIQDHGLLEQKKILPLLLKLSKETGIPLTATNDVHYIEKKDAKIQDVLMCIQTGKNVNDEDRMKFEGEEFYLKSTEEMEKLFSFAPESISNTKKIADMCCVEFEFGQLHLPKFDVPKGKEPFAYLTELCETGLLERYEKITPKIKERLDFELQTIKNMGFVDYFLIVYDFVRFAKENNIMVGPGRGSAAGSIVAYTLKITDIDPIKYNLLFERFLNPERISMPDIDIDFCYERRQEVIDYVNQKYGHDRVAQIITFGTMAAKAAIRDVGRALGIPYADVDAVAKMVPNQLGITIEKALEQSRELKGVYERDANIKELIDISMALEGLPRHASTHAAGVVISALPVKTYVPLQKNDEVITTQFPMNTLERLGLLKMDFLGLRNLTVIRDTVELVNQNGGNLDIKNIPFDKPEVFDLISRGETDGVFQLESSGMKVFMKELQPSNLEDIIAGISLYRPGPMDSIPRYIKNKNNPRLIKYKHPLLEDILNVTYGCIVYQEQVMQIVRTIGGYSMARADSVRKAMSKKNLEVMECERDVFINGALDEKGNVLIAGAVRNGVAKAVANEIYDEMIDFAKYAFNKSHAAAYAVLAYETAYLKCFYKDYFMAALFNSVIGNSDKIVGYFSDCNRMGLLVQPPDINHSEYKFTAKGGKIRFGLGAIRNVGRGFADACVSERKHGHFKGLGDFINRMTGKELNKRALEQLIKCGAFDFTGASRRQMLMMYEIMMDSSAKSHKTNIEGQMSLFGEESEEVLKDNYPNVEEYDHKTMLAMEKEALGIYISGHPLDDYKKVFDKISAINIAYIKESIEDGGGIKDGSYVTVVGILASRKDKTTKNGGVMSFITLEDLTGSLEVIVFPKTLQECDSFLNGDFPIIVRGRVNLKEEEDAKIIADEISVLNQIVSEKELYIYVRKNKEHLLDELNNIIKEGQGADDLYIVTEYDGKTHKCKLKVNVEPKIIERINAIMGEACAIEKNC